MLITKDLHLLLSSTTNQTVLVRIFTALGDVGNTTPNKIPCDRIIILRPRHAVHYTFGVKRLAI